jgi:flagellar biosynthesis/type III secretory pathway protein FliH
VTSLSHRYREFGSSSPEEAESTNIVKDDLEDLQLESFENGYQAGWEDAAKARETDAEHAAVGIAQNLQDISFTHREAYLKLGAAMKPLLTQIVERLLPPLARQVVGAHILHQLTELMDAHAENALEIVVSPDNLDDLNSMLGEMIHVPFSMVTDPILEGGQAYVRVGQSEQEIDLKAVLSGITEALEAFFEQAKEETCDG